MGVMMLAAGKGAKVLLEADGPDEADCVAALAAEACSGKKAMLLAPLGSGKTHALLVARVEGGPNLRHDPRQRQGTKDATVVSLHAGQRYVDAAWPRLAQRRLHHGHGIIAR